MNTNKDSVLRAILERLQGSLSTHLLRNLAEEEVRFAGQTPKQQKMGSTMARVGAQAKPIVSVKANVALWINFPRTILGYASMINLLCDCAYDSTVFFDYLLSWLSDKVVTSTPPFDYTSFISSISNGPLKSNQQETVDLVINVVVADIVATYFSRGEPQPPQQLQQLTEIILKFPYLYQTNRAEPNLTLRMVAMSQWSAVLGLLTPSLFAHGINFLFLGNMLQKLKLEASYFMQFLKNIRLSIRSEKEISETSLVIEKFTVFVTQAVSAKLLPEVALYLSIYTDVLSSVDLSGNPDLFSKAKLDTKMLEKLAKDENMDPIVTKFKAVLMAVGVSDFFTANIQEVSQRILKRVQAHNKYSDDFLDALCIIFRGAHHGLRISWLPNVDQSKEIQGNGEMAVLRRLPCYQYTEASRLPEVVSPFLHAPFFEKMRIQKQASFEIMRSITRNLFSSKFKLWSNTKVTTQSMADIVVNAATHSFEYLQTELLPTLLSGTICDCIVALQALQMLVCPEMKYATHAHCFVDKANILTPKDVTTSLNLEIIKAVNFSIKTLAQSIELGDSSTENRDNVGCYLSPEKIHFKNYEPIFSSSMEAQRPTVAFARVENNRGEVNKQLNGLLPLTLIDDILKNSLNRIQRLIHFDEVERREKNLKSLIAHTKKTSKAVESWISADCSFPYPNFVSGNPKLPEEQPPKIKKAPKDERLRNYQVSLMKEMLSSILALPASEFQFLELHPFGNDKVKPVPLLSYLLLHSDDDLSNLVIHFYQRIIVEIPQFRTVVLADLVQTFNSLHHSKQVLKLFVLTQISVLIDLWNSVYYTKIPPLNKVDHVNITTDQDVFLLENIIGLVQALEQMALYYLCSTDKEFRLCSLNVLNGVSLLYFLHSKDTLENPDQVRIASILKTHEHFILQEARTQFIQEMSLNLLDPHRVRHDTPLDVSIRDVAGSSHERFWTFVLSQIGRCLAFYDSSNSIVRVRTMTKILDDFELENYVSGQQVSPCAATDGLESGILFVPTLYTNCQMFLFSLANSKLLQANSDVAYQKILRHMAAWGDLLADNPAIVLSRVNASKNMSWDSASIVLASLWSWYTKVPQKRKSDIRPHIAQILYYISNSLDFSKGIILSRPVGQCYLQFIEEITVAWEPLLKSSDICHTFYYLCNIGIIINVMTAMHKYSELSLIGPLRKQFLAQPHWVLSDAWQTKHKTNLVTFLKERIPLDQMHPRAKLDRGEIDKLLNNAKERETKEKIKNFTAKQMKLIAERSAQAIEALSHVFYLVDIPHNALNATQMNAPKFWKEIGDWILPVQRICPDAHLIPWLVAHDEELMPSIMDKAYVTTDLLDKSFYIHSIYSQFIAAEYYEIDQKFHNTFKKTESTYKKSYQYLYFNDCRERVLKENPYPHQQRDPSQGDPIQPSILLREDVIYNSDKQFYITTHGLMDQFVDNLMIDEETLALARTPLSALDLTFSKKILVFSGQLLQFLFYCLIQPEVNIRIGAFHCLLRLGPIEFGKVLEITEPAQLKKVRLAMAHHENNFNSPLEEVWLSSAIALSEILCQNCAAMTLDLLTAWVNVWPHLTPLEQVRTSQLIVCWGKNIALSETGPISSQFLESLFSLVTVVACEQSNGVSTFVFSVWESFCIVSPANMAYAVKFLILRGVTKGNLEICRRLIQHLAMKAHLVHVLDTLLVNLSFQGMMENINRSNQERLNRSPSSNTTAPKSPRSIENAAFEKKPATQSKAASRRNVNQNVDAAPVKKKEEKSSLEQIFMAMRKATAAIVADLIGDDIRPIFSNLHIIIQYCLLYLDQDAHLLHTFASILLGIKEVFVNYVTKENSLAPDFASATECINIINNITTLMIANRHSFVQWDSTCYKNAGESRGHQQNVLKGFPHTQLATQATKEMTFIQERRIHSAFLDILPSKIHISKLVDYLIIILSCPALAKSMESEGYVSSPENIKRGAVLSSKPLGGHAGIKNIVQLWGQQCLHWGILFPDPLMSTKALELYSRIVKPASMDTLIKLSTNLHYSVERLMTISTVSKAIQKGALISEFFTPDAQDVDLLKVRVQVLIEAFIRIAEITDSENYIIFFFWVGCALLETSPQTYPNVFNGGINLLTAVIESKTFKAIEKGAFKNYIKLSEKWNFIGLNKLLLESLKSSKSDILGSDLIRKLLVCPNVPVEIFYESRKVNAELQDALWFLSLIPWIHYNAYSPYHIQSNCGDEFSSRSASRQLLKAVFEKFNTPTKKFHYSIFKFIQKFNSDNFKGRGSEDPFLHFPFTLATSEKFLSGLNQVFIAFFFPVHSLACFSHILDLFQQTPQRYHNVLAHITNDFLQAASKDSSIRIPGCLTDLLVFASKDVELSESLMTKKLVSLENTAEVSINSKAGSPKWHPLHLQIVESALSELVEFLKTRSNRHSVMAGENDKDKGKGDRQLKKSSSKSKQNSNNNTPPTEKKDEPQVRISRVTPLAGGGRQGTPPSLGSRDPTPSDRKVSGWAVGKTEGRLSHGPKTTESPVKEEPKTRSARGVVTTKPPIADSTSPRERLMRMQQKNSVGDINKPGVVNDSQPSGFSPVKPSNKQPQATVIDDGLASLRQLAGSLQFSLSSSGSSDSYTDSDDGGKDGKDGENSDDNFIDQFSELGIAPSNDDFDHMRSLLMNSITQTDQISDDNNSDTFDSDSDYSGSDDDLGDLRSSLAGLENF